MNYKKICEDVCLIARDAGVLIKQKISGITETDVEIKGLHDFVTHVDKQSEKQIVLALSGLVPEAGFVAEEKSNTKVGNRYNWIIDPLDGTTNYIHRLPCYSVSIALMDKDEVVMGVVYEINLNECFYSWKDGPALLNGKEIKVSDRSTIADSLIATGFPYSNYDGLDKYMKLFHYFLKNSHGLRRLGSAAVDLAYVACGRFEAFYEYGLNPWDVAAGTFIVQQAGGKVYDFTGEKNFIFGKQLVASNHAIADEIIGLVKSVYNS